MKPGEAEALSTTTIETLLLPLRVERHHVLLNFSNLLYPTYENYILRERNVKVKMTMEVVLPSDTQPTKGDDT